MLENIFASLFETGTARIGVADFLWCMAASLAIGALLAFVYTYRNTYSKSFVAALALLPAVVGVVIMMVSGSLGAGVAVAGTFSLVRFRSAPGTAREICAIFLAMAAGLATGMGYIGFAAVFAVIMAGASLLLTRFGIGSRKKTALCKTLRITIPEDLDYGGAFDDLWAEFTSSCELVGVKTTNMGSLYKLTYQLVLRDAARERELIDSLRCRNGNLEISCSRQTTKAEAL